MNFLINSKDDIGLLTESSVKSSAYSRQNTFRSSGAGSSRITDYPDTIHYLSPASTVARTECEGDFDYQQFYVSPLIHDQDADFKQDLASVTSSTTSAPCEENVLQRTLAILKPDAMEYKDVVLRAINQAGFAIVNERTLHLTPEQVSEVYEKYYGTPAFPHMVVTMSVSPILVLSLQAVNAVERWKAMVGSMGTLREEWFFPYSVRTRFGILCDMPQVLHASEGPNEAKRENRYFYPRPILEPLPDDKEKVKDYVTVYLKPTLLLGLAEIVRTKPMDPVVSLAEWLLLHNPIHPNFPEKIALSPT